MSKHITSPFNRDLIVTAMKDAILKLDPRVQIKNPVMFLVYIGALFTLINLFFDLQAHKHFSFDLQIFLWLFFTVLVANFAEALAEGRGKAHADILKKAKEDTAATQVVSGVRIKKSAMLLQKGDIIVVGPGEMIPADGDVIKGIATVDESAITGESAPVIRESGGDRSAVTQGTKVLSDEIYIQVTSEPGKSFLDRMIGLIEGAERQKTPNEIALNILLVTLSLIFLIAVFALKFQMDHIETDEHTLRLPLLIALLVCLIPTTISSLISAIGIAGMDRLVAFNVIAKSGRSVEAAGDIDLLILDKTGTITLGNRMAHQFIPAEGIPEAEFAQTAQLSSLADETPEGRSIVIFAKQKYDLRGENLQPQNSRIVPFTAETRMSGIDILDTDGNLIQEIRKGAVDAIVRYLDQKIDPVLIEVTQSISNKGGTPLLVVLNKKAVGAIYLKDIIKGGIKERFQDLRKMGIKTLMITGDNPLTAAVIAAEAGVDDFIAEATPEMKLERIRNEQKQGRLVAMTGDGLNDAPALAQADVGVAMNTGTQSSRDAGNMIDLDSNPTKLIDIVIIGKQLLMTRGSLTTFSIANDIAKYFAILPALFQGIYVSPQTHTSALSFLNIMHLRSSESAILSSVIFNALIIVILIPLALKGVAYKPLSTSSLLMRNLLIYGVGGILIPFIGIKLIDEILWLFSSFAGSLT